MMKTILNENNKEHLESKIIKPDVHAFAMINMNSIKKVDFKHSRSKGRQLFDSIRMNQAKSNLKLTIKKSKS